jgi:hypothetical protein
MVDLIEAAERSAPFCLCGAHMIAVAEGDAIWLECSERKAPKDGVGAFFARITSLGHDRRMIVKLPSAN